MFVNEFELEEQQQLGPPKTGTTWSFFHNIVNRRSLRHFQTLVAHHCHVWFPLSMRTSLQQGPGRYGKSICWSRDRDLID
jgi:hypothetical protein